MTGTINWDTSSLDSSRLDRVALDVLSLQGRSGSTTVVTVAVGSFTTVDISLWLSTEVSSIDIGLLALSGTVSLLDKCLVGLEDGLEFGSWDIVQELAFTEFTVGNGESLLAVSSLLDGLGSGSDELLVKEVVVHGETNGGDEGEPLVTLLVVDQTSRVSEGDRVCHVNGDGVTVSERDSGSQFESWGPGVAESNDTVKTELVQVW